VKTIDVNQYDHLGNTALHYAAGANHVACVELLLKAHANVKAQNNTGDTPLHKAAWRGSEKIVTLLLNSGADLSTRNKEGQTPLNLAREPSVIDLLSPSLVGVDRFEEKDEFNSDDDDDE